MFDLPVHACVVQNQDGFKWTGRYLASNAQMQEVANTLLELMSLPPHPSMHAGKTSVSISSECDHDRISGLVGLSASSDNRFRYQVSHAGSVPGRPMCNWHAMVGGRGQRQCSTAACHGC
jgi:hypothetical protein